MDEINEQQSYNSMLERFQNARDRMSLGYQTLKEENNYSQLQGRMRNRLRAWGLGYIDENSAFDRYEQMALSRGDRLAKRFQGGADIGFGGAQLGLNVAEFFGIGATKAGGRLGMASLGAGIAGYGGTASTLGRFAGLANTVTLPAQIGLSLLQGGFQHSIMDPYANTREFQSTAYGGLRQILGGTQSNRGFGGLDMSQSLDVGRSTQNLAWMNKGVSANQLNMFLKAATEMPQLQYVQNADQAVQGISKFMDVFIKLSKQFKGKEQEMVAALQSFGKMGMTIGQSEQALMYSTRMGTYLNISPNALTGAGVNAVQQAMNNGQLGGIQQGTVYNMGAQSLAQVERMRQSGAISQLQLQNFGGTEGVANMLTSSKMNFLKSSSANLFLKAIYDPTSENGINEQMMAKMVSGQYSLGDARQRAMEVTLNPKANMDFALQKDFIIGKLGDKANQFTYQAWNKQFANKSPWGKDLTGRTRWLMAYQGMDEQTAMMNAQAWMGNNPEKEMYLQELQKGQNILGNDPYYSSQKGLGVWVNTAGRDVSRWWKESAKFSAWSPLSYFNSESRPYNQFRNGIGNAISSMGFGYMSDWMLKASTTKGLAPFTPFSQFKSPKEANETWSEILKSPDKGAGLWKRAGDRISNRNAAVLMSSENIRDLMVDDSDRRSVRLVTEEFEDKFTNQLFNKYGNEDKIKQHFQGMSTADVEKELRTSVEDFTKKGGYNTKDWKNLRGKDGMTYDFNDILMSSALQKSLPPEKIKEIKNSMLASTSASGLVLKDPYATVGNYSNTKNVIRSSSVAGGMIAGAILGGEWGFAAGTVVPVAGNIGGAIGGGILGAAAGLLAPNIFMSDEKGSKQDKDNIKGFLGKFQNAGSVDAQYELYSTLKSISRSDDPEKILRDTKNRLGLATEVSMTNIKDLMGSFGDENTQGSLARKLALYKGDVKPVNEAESKAASKLRKMDKSQHLADSVRGLYGSFGYQQKALGYGAEAKFFEKTMGTLFGSTEGGQISAGDWEKMKKDLKRTPGLGDIMRDEFMEYDSATGTVKMKENMSDATKKRFEKARERMLTHDMGALENYNLQKAEDIWSKRGDAAKTIQDFAIAVKQGMSMWSTGSNELTYLNVQGDKDKLEATKREESRK